MSAYIDERAKVTVRVASRKHRRTEVVGRHECAGLGQIARGADHLGVVAVERLPLLLRKIRTRVYPARIMTNPSGIDRGSIIYVLHDLLDEPNLFFPFHVFQPLRSLVRTRRVCG